MSSVFRTMKMCSGSHPVLFSSLDSAGSMLLIKRNDSRTAKAMYAIIL
jgi:hypothetical protein